MASERDVVMRLKLAPEVAAAKKVFGDLARDTELQYVKVTKALGQPSLERQRGLIGKTLSQASNPSFVAERAGLMFQQDKAQLKLQSALSKEMTGLANADKFGPALGGLVTQLGSLGPHAAIAAAGIGAVVGGLYALHSAAVSFGGIRDPAALERYNVAWNDLNATIGRAFLPVLNQMTEGMRLAGDVFASILPDQAEFEAVLRELQPVFDDLRDVLADIAPLVKQELITALRLMALSIKIMVEAIKPYLKALNAVAALLGGGEDRKELDKADIAPRPAAYMGFEDLQKSNILASYAQGSNPAEQTAKNTERAAEALERMEAEQRSGPRVDRGTEG